MTLYIYILTIFTHLIGTGDEWTLLREHENFTVYYREIEGSKFQQLRIKAKTQASVKEVVAALEDIDFHKYWVYATQESYMLKKRSASDFDYYVSVDMPFPIKDRDIVIRYKRESDAASGVVHTYSVAREGIKDPREDFVRIKSFKSDYYIRPLAGGQTEIEYTVSADPGGSLPAWLVNLLKARGPTRTISTLLKHLEEGRYEERAVEGL